MKVTKSNETLQELDISKIRNAIKWACEGLENVDPMKIEMGAQIQFYDGIKTSEIQTAMIKSAQRLISEDAPDYSFVGARLMLMNIYKQAGSKEETGLSYKPMSDVLEKALEHDRIDGRLLTDFDLDAIDKAINPEHDKLFGLLGLATVEDRYLLRETSKREELGPVIEMPQQFWMRVAMGLCLNYKDIETRTSKAIDIYNEYSQLNFVSSTPTLFNSGTPFSQMSSCYGNTVSDDLVGQYGIFDKIKECAKLSKFAGGIGTDWNQVRSEGSPIHSTNGKSSGIVPFLKVFNDTSVAVNQCFAPETLLYTSNGVKQICDIEPEKDLVLTERGVYREVQQLLDYEQTDDMLEVSIKHAIEPVRVTTEHPFYAIQGVPLEQTNSRTYKWLEKRKITPEWVDAKGLQKGDYVALPIPSEIVTADGFDEDTARLYGIMLGDGHVRCKNGKPIEMGVSFNRDKNETHLAFVRDYLSAKGISYWQCDSKNSSLTQIRWTYSADTAIKRCEKEGKLLAKESTSPLPFDYNDLYNESGVKRIHPRLAHLPLQQSKALVRGLIETDGCVSRGKEITFHNTSQELVENLRYQMLRLAVPTAGNMRHRVYNHFIERSDGTIDEINSRGVCYDVRIPAVDWLAECFGIPALTKKNWIEFGKMLFTRVKSVTALSDNEKPAVVYDLRVEGIHSYTLVNGLVHNGGKRKGAFAAYIEPWHGDAQDFMTLKRNAGEERRRTHDIFPAWWANDLLFERVKAGGQWSFFDPKDVPALHDLFGEEFKAAYEQAEADGLATNTVPAAEFWRSLILSLIETGAPWITYKDEHNRRNPQQHIGVVHNTNLCCMASDQRVVTEKGILTVGEMYESQEKLKVAGRKEMVEASAMLLPRPDAPMVRIHTAQGYTHDVTPDHRVWVEKKGWVEAQDLIKGDKLSLQTHSAFGEVNEPELAMFAGLVAADGTFTDNAVCVDIWEKTAGFKTKEQLEDRARFVIEKHVPDLSRLGKSGRQSSIPASATPTFTENKKHQRWRMTSSGLAAALDKFGFNKETKLKVPEFVWKGNYNTVKAYLRSVYVCDGTVQATKDLTTASLSSVSKTFLQEIQILWANLGVKTSLTKIRGASKRPLPDGKGGSKEYECQSMYRLMHSSVSACDVLENVTQLGVYRNNIQFLENLIHKKGYKQKMNAEFSHLEELENADAYCLEVKNDDHAWTVNGLITHNTEISLNNSGDETFVCNLGSINLSKMVENGKINWNKLANTVTIAIEALDNVIDLNYYPSPESKNSNLKHRPIGLGVMGYAEALNMCGIDYESQEHLEWSDKLFEAISYHAIAASCQLAIERGAYSSFNGSLWSKGILTPHTASKSAQALTERGQQELSDEWAELSELVAKVGIRNCNLLAIAPTATIANIAGTTPCTELSIDRVSQKANLGGTFKFFDPCLRHNKHLAKYAYDIDQTWFIKSASVRQKWVDQAQSLNLYRRPEITGRIVAEWYLLAWELALKSTYYLKNKKKNSEMNKAGEK